METRPNQPQDLLSADRPWMPYPDPTSRSFQPAVPFPFASKNLLSGDRQSKIFTFFLIKMRLEYSQQNVQMWDLRLRPKPTESESALSKDPPGILSSLKHEKHCMWGPCRHWVMFLWTWPVHGLMSFSGLQTSSKPTHCFSRVFVLLVLVYISLGDIRKHTVLKNPMPREEHLWVTQGLLFHC